MLLILIETSFYSSLMKSQFAADPTLMGGDHDLVSDPAMHLHLMVQRDSAYWLTEHPGNDWNMVWSKCEYICIHACKYTVYFHVHIPWLTIYFYHDLWCKINNIISDHATLSLLHPLSINKQRRFNNVLLYSRVCVFDEGENSRVHVNLNSVPSIQIVWEAFKTICRGQIINYSAAKKKRMMMNEKKNSYFNIWFYKIRHKNRSTYWTPIIYDLKM